MSKDTPCIAVCMIDPKTSLCFGCGRTLPEIARWGRMDRAERLAGSLAGNYWRAEALSAVAVAVAAGRIGAGRISEALVLGVAQRRGYAILLAGP